MAVIPRRPFTNCRDMRDVHPTTQVHIQTHLLSLAGCEVSYQAHDMIPYAGHDNDLKGRPEEECIGGMTRQSLGERNKNILRLNLFDRFLVCISINTVPISL